MKLEASPEQLEILSVKEDNDQIKIEFRAPNTSAISIAGAYGEPHGNHTNTKIKIEDEFQYGATIISAQSIPTTWVEPTNGEVDIKIEDEMEFVSLSSTAQSIPGTDDEEYNNQPVQDQFAEIKTEDEIGEPSISVQSIPTNDARKYRTIQDEYAEIKDEMECGEEVEQDELNTLQTAVIKKPDVSDGNKPQSEFTCDICSKKYSTKSNLITHRLRHGKPNFNCTVCGVPKITQRELDKHMKTHNTKIKDSNPIHFTKFQCTVCGVPKRTHHEMYIHMGTHDTNPIYLTCDLCPKKYTLIANLIAHRKTHGPIEKLFTCDICSKKFPTKDHLNIHRKRHGKLKFKCNICDVAKFSQYEIKRHMRIHDTNRIYFTCDLCPKNYASKAYLLAHMVTHDPTANLLPCELCSKKFSTEMNLTQHRLRHGQSNFHCTICDVVSSTHHEMYRHMRTHD